MTTLNPTGSRLPVELRIVVPLWARVVALLKAAIAFFLGFGLLGLAAQLSTRLENADAAEVATMYPLLLLAALAFPAAIFIGISLLRVTFHRRARIEIFEDNLVIHHAGVFRRPVTLSREQIASVSVDARRARFRSRNHPRFHLATGTQELAHQPEWLFSKTGGAPFPLLAHVRDVPNTALVFSAPLTFQKVRRWIKPFPSKMAVHPPLHKRPARGLLARLKDPDQARTAFGEWGILRPLTAADLASKAPSAEQEAKAARHTRRATLVLGGVILAQVLIPLALSLFIDKPFGFGPADSQTLSAAGEFCADQGTDEAFDVSSGTKLDSRFTSLSDALLAELPGDPALVFDSPIDAGDAALSSTPDVRRWTKELLDHGFERGYARRWLTAGLEIRASVWEFAGPEEAEDFERFARRDACEAIQEAFLIPEIRGAVGMTLVFEGTEDVFLDQVTFVRGPYRFAIATELPEPDVDHAEARALAIRQHTLIE